MIDINAVCGFCRHHEKDVSIEINFKDKKIYYICPKCKKENIVDMAVKNAPYPTGVSI